MTKKQVLFLPDWQCRWLIIVWTRNINQSTSCQADGLPGDRAGSSNAYKWSRRNGEIVDRVQPPTHHRQTSQIIMSRFHRAPLLWTKCFVKLSNNVSRGCLHSRVGMDNIQNTISSPNFCFEPHFVYYFVNKNSRDLQMMFWFSPVSHVISTCAKIVLHAIAHYFRLSFYWAEDDAPFEEETLAARFYCWCGYLVHHHQ